MALPGDDAGDGGALVRSLPKTFFLGLKAPGPVRILQLVGGAVAVAMLVYVTRNAWLEWSSSPLDVHRGAVALSMAVLALGQLATVGIWTQLLADLGTKVRFREALQLWSFSNLGRYVPGKIWQVVGLVVIARDLGVAPGAAATCAFVALGFMIVSSAAVAMIFVPGVWAPPQWSWESAVLVLGLSVLVPIVWPTVVSGMVRRLPRFVGCGPMDSYGRMQAFRIVAGFFVVWALHGVAFFLFVRSFAHLPWSALPELTGVYCLAYVTGLIALFAPGGLGVREGVLGAMLGDVAGPDFPAHACALAARLWSIVPEVFLLIAALGVRWGTVRKS